MPYRRGRTLRDLVAPDTRRRNAVLMVLGGMIAGSLLTLGARELPSVEVPTRCPFEETIPFQAARDGVTPVESLDARYVWRVRKLDADDEVPRVSTAAPDDPFNRL